ncbi:MAG: hypothetical protein ABEL97_10850 [Salinibacter sp.]
MVLRPCPLLRLLLLLGLMASVLHTPAEAQRTAPDTIRLGSVSLRDVPIDTTLELRRAGLTYRDTDRFALYEGGGTVLRDRTVRLRCASLSGCRREAASPDSGRRETSPGAEWPLPVTIRAGADPGAYLVEVRDSTGRIRHYRRLYLRPPRPRVERVQVRQGGRVRPDTVRVDPRTALTARLLLIGGPFYPRTQVSLAQRTLRTEVLARDTMRVSLQVGAASVRDLLLGARRLPLTHPLVGGTSSGWGGAAADVYLKGARPPRIDEWPRQINIERGFREVVVEGAGFSPSAELCVRSGTYDLGAERCISRTTREGRTLRADVDFGTPPDRFVGGDIALYVRNGDDQTSDPVTVEVRPLETTAEATLARSGGAVVAGVPTEVIFYRREGAPVFPRSGDDDVNLDNVQLRIGDQRARLFVENSDADRMRAIVTVPEGLGGQTPTFDLRVPSRGHTWTGRFVPVKRRPRLTRTPPPTLRRGGTTRFVFSNGLEGTLVSGTDGVRVLEGELDDAEATVEATTARTGTDARFYIRVGGRAIDSLEVGVKPWPHPRTVVRLGVPRDGAVRTVPVDSLSPVVLPPGTALRVQPADDAPRAPSPRVDVVLRKANGTALSDPMALDFGQSGGRAIRPELYGLSGGDAFFVVLRAPDGTTARQRVYVERTFLERWNVSGGFSAIEYSLRDGQARTTNGVQMATHYMFGRPRGEKRLLGVGAHLIASGVEDRVRLRVAGSVLLFETVAVGLGGWRDPFLFLGANVRFLDLSSLFRRDGRAGN